LHVKSFLAGKKGICPDCGAKVEIPYQSTRSSSKGEANDPVSQAPPDTPLAMPVEPRGDSPPPKSANPAHSTASPGEQAMAGPKQEQTAAQPKPPGGPAAPSSGPIGEKFGRLPHPSRPDEQATSVPMRKPAEESRPKPAPAQAAPSQPPGDPIDEAPQAVWYVRPKTGGQYGPAPGDVFRRWLEEGRVGSDSLVWREGWPEWKLASETFDKFKATESSPQPPSTPAAGSGSGPIVVNAPATTRSPEQQRLVAKRNTANATIMFIILLVLATTVLIPVIIWVLISQ